ncbi:hypothetical protein, partial [Vibrio vulnificus]|uniref:hypothetical protein n=1 Tax=Vibrio vulnificus TaxID=672 RepID=UPI00188BE0E5
VRFEQTPLSLALQCSGVPTATPLFTAMLNYRHNVRPDAAAQEAAWPGVELIASQERSNYPLSLSADDTGVDFVLST